MEIAVVLVIAGTLALVGVAAFSSLIQTRKAAKTQAALEQAKSCLVGRVYRSEQYPTYTPGLNCTSVVDESRDVDACLCASPARDAWGGAILYLEGISAPGVGLAGKFFATNPPRGQTRVPPHLSAQAVDTSGVLLPDLAFVLISRGKNKAADNASYDLFAGGVLATQMAAQPDFSTAADDQALIVASDELLALLKK